MEDGHSITIITPEEESNSAKIFEAFLQRDVEESVKRICSRLPKGALQSCNIHDSTVLHLACYLGYYNLASHLFESLNEGDYKLLPELQNKWGSTVLHDAATNDGKDGCDFVRKLLGKIPDLLKVTDLVGESAIFGAIAYGSTVEDSMYSLLATEIENINLRDRLPLLQRSDQKTILHIAIRTRKFEIAVDIAERFQELCNLKDVKKRTALQMLALCPTAFKSGANLNCLEDFIYSIVIVPNEEQGTRGAVSIIKKAINFILCRGCCVCPKIEELKEMKKTHNDAVKLAKILIKEDKSWRESTYKPVRKVERVEPSNEGDVDDEAEGDVGDNEAPLFLATRMRCNEIVNEILTQFPQAVDYINSNQENLLHVAIKNRNFDVFNYVINKSLSNKGLFCAVDSKENCLLHMVGSPKTTLKKASEDIIKKSSEDRKKKTLFSGLQSSSAVSKGDDEVSEDTKLVTPVQQLSDDLMLLEELEKRCPDYMKNHRNYDNLTPRELLAKEREKLRSDATDYLKRTAEQCIVVIVLIATVAFAAAYTVPGGPDEKTGKPVLVDQPLFLVFTVADVLSLGFALTAVIVFLTILTSPFRLEDFQRSLPQKLLLGFTLLFLSVSSMMIAFAATIILTVRNQQQWSKFALYIVSFFPVLIFMLSYVNFYVELYRTLVYCFIKMGRYLHRTPACKPKPTLYAPLKRNMWH